MLGPVALVIRFGRELPRNPGGLSSVRARPIALLLVLLVAAAGAAACGGEAEDLSTAPAPLITNAERSGVDEGAVSERDGIEGALGERVSGRGEVDAEVDPLGWERVELGEAPIDSQPAVVALEETTVVLSRGSDATLESWVSSDGATYEQSATGSPVGTSVMLSAAASGARGLLAVGVDYETFLPVVWGSDDGRAWERLETGGLDRAADITVLVGTSGGFVAGGAFRVGRDPGSGPFAPALWRSLDGDSWEPIELAAAREGYVSGIVTAGDRFVVAGASGRNAVVWSSDDAGATWSRSRPGPLRKSGPASFTSIASSPDGSTIVAVGGAADETRGDVPFVLVSRDRGESWQRAELDGALWEGMLGGGIVTATEQDFFFIGGRFFTTFSDPDRCYAQPETCETGTAVVLRSADGERWEELDLGALNTGDFFRPLRVARDHTGALLLVGAGEQLELHRWSGSDGPPSLPPPAPLPPPEIPLATYETELELGVTYRYPLYIHCGMRVLGSFNEQFWYLDETDGPNPETGSTAPVPEEWPTAGQSILGHITLTSEKTIDYSLPNGEIIATYTPSDEQPPGCA